eukprot:scaffold3747_cov240-Pinguiococcus_pyrenoidosus.AAC.16
MKDPHQGLVGPLSRCGLAHFQRSIPNDLVPPNFTGFGLLQEVRKRVRVLEALRIVLEKAHFQVDAHDERETPARRDFHFLVVFALPLSPEASQKEKDEEEKEKEEEEEEARRVRQILTLEPLELAGSHDHAVLRLSCSRLIIYSSFLRSAGGNLQVQKHVYHVGHLLVVRGRDLHANRCVREIRELREGGVKVLLDRQLRRSVLPPSQLLFKSPVVPSPGLHDVVEGGGRPGLFLQFDVHDYQGVQQL